VAHEDYKTCLLSTICKGSKTYPGLLDKNGADIAQECFQIAGRQDAAAAILPVLFDDTPRGYIERMSLNWDAINYSDGFELKDRDWLVFSWSADGSEGMNDQPIFSSGGNVTTGFLIAASGDFPVAWLSHDPSILSGVYPLEECLGMRYFSENKRGKIDVVFRLKGDQ